MPKEKQQDGSTKVVFKTKAGKEVVFCRKPGSGSKKRKQHPDEASQPAEKSQRQSTEQPTNLQPVLVLNDK
jgi:hypothetical protein